MSKSNYHLLLALLVVAVFSGCRNKDQMPEKQAAVAGPALEFRCDRRVETVYLVLMLTGKYDQLISRHPSSYKNKAVRYFSRFSNHMAVAVAGRLIDRGFCFDYAANWIFQFSDLPEFENNYRVDFSFSERPVNADSLELLRKELISFYTETKCDSFFTAQNQFFEKMISKAETSISRKDLPNVIEDYYGIHKDADYSVVLSPLMHSGGYAIECDNKTTNKKQLLAMCGPNGEIDFIPVFDRQFLEYDMIIHELGHNYINPVADHFKKETAAITAVLYPLVKENMENEGVGEESFIYELLNRAITIRIVANAYGQEAADKLLDYEKSIGFKWVQTVADDLKNYERQRDKYPALTDFMPQIIQRLDQNK
jgi:hypothetical protein